MAMKALAARARSGSICSMPGATRRFTRSANGRRLPDGGCHPRRGNPCARCSGDVSQCGGVRTRPDGSSEQVSDTRRIDPLATSPMRPVSPTRRILRAGSKTHLRRHARRVSPASSLIFAGRHAGFRLTRWSWRRGPCGGRGKSPTRRGSARSPTGRSCAPARLRPSRRSSQPARLCDRR